MAGTEASMAALNRSCAAIRRHVIVVGTVMALLGSGAWPGASWSAAAASIADPPIGQDGEQQGEIQEVRTVWTNEFGVPRPRGLAYDPSRGEFLVAGDDPNGTRILRLGPDEDPRGSFLLPQLANPRTLAFDGLRARLTAVDGDVRVEVPDRALTTGRPPTQRVPIDGLELEAPASATFDEQTDTWFVLEQTADTVALVVGETFSGPRDRLELSPSAADRLIAFHPSEDLLYVMDPDEGRVDGVDRDGNIATSFSLASSELFDPVAMTFAPSTDPTDDADNLNLYVADSGGDTTLGGVTELSLTADTTLTASVDTATLVQTIHTSQWEPASPDPSGIVWMPAAGELGELVVVDSEVEETTGAGWNDVNLWRTTRTGGVVGTGTMWGSNSAGSYSKEPTGLGYDAATDTLFVSDDSAGAVFVVQPGGDGLFGTSDDVVDSIDTGQFGSNDTEDPEFDPATGDLFFLDGSGMEIYRIDPVDGTFGNGDDTMSHFDISHLGPKDFEGLSSNPGRNTLFVGARTTEEIYEISFDGTLVRRIDVPVSELRYISGLGVAPASDGTGRTNLWIVDRAVDNGADPNENDGKIFEIAAPDIGGPTTDNTAPVVDGVTIDQSSPQTNDTLTVTVDASDADGDSLTYRYQWINNDVDIVGATDATLDLSVAGNGDKGDAIAVRVTASDGTATSDPVTSAEVTVVDTPPVFDQDLGDQSSVEGATVSLSASATDPDDDPLTYEASGLPADLTIDGSTGLISGTVAVGAASNSPYAVSVTVRDGTTTDDTDTFTWSVTVEPAPAAPTGLDATASSVAVTLNWDDNTEPDLAGYHVYRSANETGPYERLNASLLGDPTYVDDTAAQGTSYYRVTAVDTSGRESTPAETSAARRILFRSASFDATRNATSVSVPRPSGVATGDVMVAVIGVRGTPNITAPGGWALARVDTHGSTMRQAVYHRVATATEPSSYSWGFSARTASTGGLVLAYQGVDTVTPVDAASGRPNTASSSITAPALSTSVSETLLVGLFGVANNPTITEPPGMLEQAEVVQNAGRDKLAMEAADSVLPGTGSSGAMTATANKSGDNIGQLIALRPDSP
jgi:hypothetical protein